MTKFIEIKSCEDCFDKIDCSTIENCPSCFMSTEYFAESRKGKDVHPKCPLPEMIQEAFVEEKIGGHQPTHSNLNPEPPKGGSGLPERKQ